jgi:hypothetical protein
MRNIEVKVLRTLIFITIFVFLCQLIIFIANPFIAPQDSLNSFKFYSFVVTFFGLHTFFALCTFISTRLISSNQLSLLTLGASIFIPTVYLILNINYLSDLNIPTFSIVLFSVMVFDFTRKDVKGNYVRKYIKVLMNPFYLEDETFGFNEIW